MYTQYRRFDAAFCLVLPEGTPARIGASSFVNPLTALGMVETMRREGHTALVHTAAASNLGQMLAKLCLEDEVPLVNIVRKPEQEEILRAIGTEHVLNSTSPTFMDDLIAALRRTKATLAFDAIGGGKLAVADPDRHGGSGHGRRRRVQPLRLRHPQAGLHLRRLDREPTVLNRSFGMAWGIGGWLLTPFLGQVGLETFLALRRAGRRGAGDDLRQQLRERGEPGGGAAAGRPF